MFQRRLIIFSLLVLGVIGILIIRLAWLQIIRGEKSLESARQLLQENPYWLETTRGSILDCRGRTLARDEADFQVCLHYRLMRLYDERFWKDQRLRYLTRKGNENKTPADADRDLWEKFGPQRRRANRLLAELAQLCGISMDKIHEAIQEVNERIFTWRTSRTRRLWYIRHNVPYEPALNATAIEEDFARRVPDPDERLRLIYKTEVEEMNRPQPILESIDRETALAIEERFVGAFLSDTGHNRPVTIRDGKKRQYPYADAACHLIGQLRSLWEESLSKPFRGRLPTAEELKGYYYGDRTGDWGTEYLFEDYLRGQRGWVLPSSEPNQVARIEPVFGSDVTLTIDIELQKRIQNVFAGNNLADQEFLGAAVVIDVPTGQVKALVSWPTFDLNTYYLKENYDLINEISDTKDKLKRGTNRALSKNYQPGSTSKPILLLGALDQGVIDEQESFDCNIQNKNWPGKPDHIYNHGPTQSRKAIQVSCNFYFIQLGLRFGRDKLLQWMQQAGFSKPILTWPADISEQRALEAFRETAGHIAPLTGNFSIYHLRFISVGLHPLDGSVLQMANTAATIARGGLFLHPSLILSPPSPPQQQRIAAEKYARVVQEGMRSVIYEPAGTAYDAFHAGQDGQIPWDEDEVRIYGKTGTTDFSVFVCYAQARDGRCLAVGVVAEVEAHGGTTAAMLAREILLACSAEGYLPAGKSQASE